MRKSAENEATNSANIGGYKNTPIIPEPIRTTKAHWREPGSAMYWKQWLDKLAENATRYIESWGMPVSKVVDLVIINLMQSSKWDFSQFIENEELDALTLQQNEDKLKSLVSKYIIPALDVAVEDSFNPADIGSIMSSNATIKSAISVVYEEMAGVTTESMRLVEGFLDDLLSIAQPVPQEDHSEESKPANNYIEQFIKPHTLEELYQGVLYQLRKNCPSDTVRTMIMPVFYPKPGEYREFAGVDDDVIRAYKQKFENAIGEYISADAIDICQRTAEIAKKRGETFTADQYFGTILATVCKDEYDLIDNMEAIFDEFEKQVKEELGVDKLEKPQKRGAAKTLDADSNWTDGMRQLTRQFEGHSEAELRDAIMKLATSEIGIGIIKQYFNASKEG